MNKTEAIKYQMEHRVKHDIGGLADYVIGGLDSPIFKGAAIKTFEHKSDYDNVMSELNSSGEYANNDLLMVNFDIDSKSYDMWVHELLNALFECFGTQREMSVADFKSVCEEFKTYMGDDSEYEIAYFPDGDDYYDTEDNEALFFVEYTGRGDELVDITFCVAVED